MISMRTVLILAVALLCPLMAFGQLNFYEDFSSTAYMDAANSTAWWDASAGEIKLYPFNLSIVGSNSTLDNSYDIVVEGNYAFVAVADSGLQIFDITDPAIPILAGGIRTADRALGLAVAGNYAFVADEECCVEHLPSVLPVTRSRPSRSCRRIGRGRRC